MKTTKIYIYNYQSKHFPIMAKWKTEKGSSTNQNVFGNMKELQNYFFGLYWRPVFIDKR